VNRRPSVGSTAEALVTGSVDITWLHLSWVEPRIQRHKEVENRLTQDLCCDCIVWSVNRWPIEWSTLRPTVLDRQSALNRHNQTSNACYDCCKQLVVAICWQQQWDNRSALLVVGQRQRHFRHALLGPKQSLIFGSLIGGRRERSLL